MLSRMSQVSVRRSINSTSRRNMSSLFPKWTKPIVVTNGDYREEAWLEQHIGGPLYEHQDKLPRLPVPKIEDTLQKFLPTALPLAVNESEQQQLKTAVDKFPQQALKLQERLLARADPNASPFKDSSWLQLWWNTLGYLQVRDPVTINVSYFFQFSDDPTVVPAAATAAANSLPNTQRAAALVTAAAMYRREVCSGNKPAERVGKKGKETILCSTAFKYMFHSCRIPQLIQDSVELHDPSQHNHLVIARNGQFFKMDFCDTVTGLPYPASVLQKGFQDCIQMADSSPNTAPKLGWLTSQDRDDWANARQALLETGGPAMQQALEQLQSAAFLVCLDDVTVFGKDECAEWCLHGSLHSGMNRWFDKSMQLIVSNTGKAAFVGEHSMMDGMPLVGFCDALTKTTWQTANQATAGAPPASCTVRPIFDEAFQAMNTAKIEPFVQKAEAAFTDLVTRHEMSVQRFHGYGSDFMKQSGYSPDAFVQVAMQLATYRLWGHQAGTYEATQVRPFLHGRTETTRSVSLESADFVNSMGLRPLLTTDDAADKVAKLQAAVQAHVKYIGNAAKAQGVDRHFFGLSMLVDSEKGESMPDLYSDPVFVRSKRWRVSTSHLTHPKFDNWGYGEVFPDGVGLSYSIHPRHCVFNVTSLKEHGWATKLTQLLEEALLEIRSLIEAETAKQQPPKSKL